MNAYKQEFDQKREKIMSILKEAEDFYRENGPAEEAETFRSLAAQLMAGEFSIVVVGEFSAGKSTFLNALLGERILPSFTSETTATVNFLKHKDKAPHGEAGIVYYADGTMQPLEKADFATIQKYVSTKSDIQVAQRVEHLDLFLESKFLQEGVTLVDSPGLNGTKEHHKEITERQIERSSASIFMFRADQPGSSSDFAFLRELRQKVNTIIFVMNKIDTINPGQGDTVESVVNDLRKNYKEQFPEDTVMPEIWPIAAYPALVARSREPLEYREIRNPSEEQKKKWLIASKMEAFEDRLWKFLTNGEKAHQMLLEPVNRTINLISQERDKKKEERDILGKKDDTGEIRNQIAELEAQEKTLEIKINKLRNEISQILTEIMRDEKESIVAKIDSYREKKQGEIDTWENVNDYDDYTENFNADVKRRLERIAREADEDMSDRIRQEIQMKYSEIVDEINGELEKNEISMQISQTYEPKEASFVSAMDRYEAEIEGQRARLQEIQAEMEKIELERVKARKMEREKERLREQVERLEEEKKMYEETFTPPTMVYREEDKVELENRRGLIGILIVQPLVGKKEKIRRVTKDNQKEIDIWRQNWDRAVAARDKKIQEAEKEYQEAALGEKSSEELELLQRRKERQLAEIREEFKELRERFRKEFQEKQKAFLRRQKLEVSNYLLELSEDVSKELSGQMKKKGEQLVGAICSAISAGLKTELEQMRKQRQNWESRLEASESDRNASMTRLAEEMEALEKLLNRAIEIRAEVDGERDTVRQSI